MELFLTPTKIKTEFSVSLLHSLLTTIGLLHLQRQLEGLDEWVRQQHITSHKNDYLLNPLRMLILFATGIQGYLTDFIPKDHNANTDFDALWEALQTLNIIEFQEACLHALHERLIKLEILPTTHLLPNDQMKLVNLIDQAQERLKRYWEQDAPMDSESFVDLLLRPNVLRQQVLDGIWHFWHTVYHEQAIVDLEQQQRALNFHTKQNYGDDFPIVFRDITGRNLPHYLHERLPSLRSIELLPHCHVGMYTTVAIYGDKCWIAFNANLESSISGEKSTSIVRLYPSLKALADETRLKIVSILSTQTLNVGEIAEALQLTQSTASRHLALLAKTDILNVRRDGTMRYYTLNPETVEAIANHLKQLT